MMKRRIAVPCLGLLTPVGIGVDETWESIISGRSGVGEVTLFDASNYETKIAAEVKNFDPSKFMLPGVFRKIDRFAQFGVAAAKMAMIDADLDGVINKEANKVAVVIGSGLGGSLFHE